MLHPIWRDNGERQSSWRVIAGLMLLAVFAPFLAHAQTTLTIVHTSEHHGTLEPLEGGPYTGLGGVTRRAALIQEVRQQAERVLVVDSGDLLIGTAMSAMFRGEADIAAMNLMGYDALAVGNHEFDFGLDHLQKLRRQAKFPFLCTNLKPRQPDVCQRFAIKTIGPLRIALIGLLGKGNYPDNFSPEFVRDVGFQDPIEAARQVVSEVRESVELVVAITHQDTAEDLALARAIPGLDVIVGGHTPGFDGLIPPGKTVPEEGRIELAGAGPVFVKTHRQGRTLGRLDLLYLDHTVMLAEASNIQVDSHIVPNPVMDRLVRDYAHRLNDETSRVIGVASADLHGESETVRTRETNLGDLVADLARREFGADVALINAGTIRGSIPAGPVSYKRLVEVLPFDSSVAVVVIRGSDLRLALENGVSRLPESSGRFLQVSGLKFTMNPVAPVGSRIEHVEIKNKPLEPDRDYSIAVTRFILEGGDGYVAFAKASHRRNSDTPLRDLVARALEAGPIGSPVESRILSMSIP